MQAKFKYKELKPKPFNLKNKKPDLISKKIENVLPELMSRNVKLCERLKNKLKVSTFFNNAEHRNQKYLKSFVYCSDKRVKDIKTGLEIHKAIKQNSKNMSLLCNQIYNDCILKNADFLLEEKKLISENTEQETHLKINDLINIIKTTIKPSTKKTIKQDKKIQKSLSEDEIKTAKNFISSKIKMEENTIDEKINKYLEKLHKHLENNDKNENFKTVEYFKKRKDYTKYVNNLYIKSGIRFINYTKPKPFQIKDKDAANMVRIQKQLMKFYEIKRTKTNKTNSENFDSSINNNNLEDDNIKNINSTMYNPSVKMMDRDQIIVNGQDTIQVLNNLANQGRFLNRKINRKIKRVNSLIEAELPNPKNYDFLINFYKLKAMNKKNSKTPSNDNRSYFKKIDNFGKTSYEDLAKRKLAMIKNEMQSEQFNKLFVFDPMFITHLNYVRKNNDSNLVNKKNNDESEKVDINKENKDKNKNKDLFLNTKKIIEEQKKGIKFKKILSNEKLKTTNKFYPRRNESLKAIKSSN